MFIRKTKNRILLPQEKDSVFSKVGRDKRERTADLSNAIQALSQAVCAHAPVADAGEMQ